MIRPKPTEIKRAEQDGGELPRKVGYPFAWKIMNKVFHLHLALGWFPHRLSMNRMSIRTDNG